MDAPERTTHFQIPVPKTGDAMLFARDDGYSTVRVAAAGVARVLDARGAEVTGIRFDHVVQVAGEDGGRYSAYSEIYDRSRHKVIAFSTCASIGHGFHPDPSYCDNSTRLTASYLEHSTPGIMGASAFWGRSMDKGDAIRVDIHVFNTTYPVEYHVTPLDGPGPRCAWLVTESTLPALSGQRFSRFADPPRRLLFCEDSPYPRVTEFDERGRFELTSWSRGGTVPDMEGAAVDPFSIPVAENVTQGRGGVPPGVEKGPSGFPLRMAFDWYVRHALHDDRGAETDRWVLRFSTIDSYGAATTRTPLGNIITTSTADRHLRVEEAHSTRVFEATLRRECRFVLCQIEVLSEEETRAEPSLPADLRWQSASFDEVRSSSERILGGPLDWYAVGTIIPDWKGPDYGPGDRFIFTGYQSPEDGFGVPYYVRVDGATGKPLEFHVPFENGIRLIGIQDT